MKIQIRNRCSDFSTYRAARVKSLFNVDSGCNFDHDADLPFEGQEWKVGLIVGPSGSGKTSIGRQIFGDGAMYAPEWKAGSPIIDEISPDSEFEGVTGALAAVGLGSVPSWLRPYEVLSNGEKFRANLARLIAEAPAHAVVDEFTSVVDRQIAKFGSLAFAKAWRRTAGQAVLLSCHYDIIDWIQPDWVYDTARGEFHGRWLRRRPDFTLEIWETSGRYWPLFEPHHYLKLKNMVAGKHYVGAVDGEPVCHVAFAPRLGQSAMRASRMVVMPEWQGAGVGLRFLNWLCEWHRAGHGPYGARAHRGVYFHTSHPGLVRALRRDPCWRQCSASLYGANKIHSAATLKRSGSAATCGFGGHFRAVQGFHYFRQGGAP